MVEAHTQEIRHAFFVFFFFLVCFYSGKEKYLLPLLPVSSSFLWQIQAHFKDLTYEITISQPAYISFSECISFQLERNDFNELIIEPFTCDLHRHLAFTWIQVHSTGMTGERVNRQERNQSFKLFPSFYLVLQVKSSVSCKLQNQILVSILFHNPQSHTVRKEVLMLLLL